MKQKSIWLNDVKNNNKKPQWKKLKTDILIIGGGIAGLSVAEQLKEENKKVTLIDSGTIGFGVTGYTTAKITPMQEVTYQTITKEYGIAAAKLYFESQQEALNIIEKNIKQYQIDCEFEKIISYTLAADKQSLTKLEQEAQIFEELKIPYETTTTLPIPISFLSGIGIPSAVFHPIHYLYGLKKEVEKTIAIYENVRAIRFDKKENYIVTTTQGPIEAEIVIVCTHYPFFLFPGLIPLKNHIEKSYIIASKEKNPHAIACITTGLPMHSIRYYKDYILYGSCAHISTNHLDSEKNYQNMEERFSNVIEGNIEYEWFNQDLITNDSLPFIGETEENSNLYIATGFNTWGMTNGTIAGKIIADQIHHIENPYSNLFSLHRKGNFIKYKNFVQDTLHYMKIFLTTTLVKNHKFYPKNIKIIKENGKTIGVYKDEKNKEHKVYLKCPHMKCNLIFNAKEKTWDCPCHSSRFDIDGNVIKGPSTTSIRYHK